MRGKDMIDVSQNRHADHALLSQTSHAHASMSTGENIHSEAL